MGCTEIIIIKKSSNHIIFTWTRLTYKASNLPMDSITIPIPKNLPFNSILGTVYKL